VAADSSSLYACNVLDFLKLVLTKEGTFNVPLDDDVVVACLMTQDGQVKESFGRQLPGCLPRTVIQSPRPFAPPESIRDRR